MSAKKKDDLTELRKQVAGMSGLIARVCAVLGLNVPPPADGQSKEQVEHQALAAWCKERQEAGE